MFGSISTRSNTRAWEGVSTYGYEMVSGGATKVELTGHLYDNKGAAPTLLDYWRGSHYGGSVCAIAAKESWSKVVGPILIYCNAGAEPAALWKEALGRAAKEAAAWPYDWVKGVDYPHKAQRGVVSGKIILTDAQFPGLVISNILAGLAVPDYTPPGGARLVDWQTDAKYYQFWTRFLDRRSSVLMRGKGSLSERVMLESLTSFVACIP